MIYIVFLIPVVALIGVVAWRTAQNRAARRAQRDREFINAAISEGLACVGYSCVAGCNSLDAAITAGRTYCALNGKAPVMAVSMAAYGMLAVYTGQHNYSQNATQQMIGQLTVRLAESFSMPPEQLQHDCRQVRSDNPAALAILEGVAARHFYSHIDIHDSELGNHVRAVAQAWKKEPSWVQRR